MTAPSLLAAYERWRAAQDTVATKATAPSREEIERRAFKKGCRRLVKNFANGWPIDAAAKDAHARYRQHGGKMAFAAWRRKLKDNA